MVTGVLLAAGCRQAVRLEGLALRRPTAARAETRLIGLGSSRQ
jgi:hypothetical protein